MINDNEMVVINHQHKVDHYIKDYLQNNSLFSVENDLTNAIKYTVFNNSKRMRSKCFYSVLDQLLDVKGFLKDESQKDESFKDELISIIESAAVIPEFMHIASLILDDMPSMDNESVRNQREAAHVKFNCATAQLAALTLIGMSTDVMLRTISLLTENNNGSDSNVISKYFARLNADNIGIKGIIHGQWIDIFGVNQDNYIEMIIGKTGRLFEMSFALPYLLLSGVGGISSSFEEYKFSLFRRLGVVYGILYQIRDDLKDNDSIVKLFSKDKIDEMIKLYEDEYEYLSDQLGVKVLF